MNANPQRHLENLRRNYERRLHVLEEKAATLGFNTPPETLIEIEDIRTELDKLKGVPIMAQSKTRWKALRNRPIALGFIVIIAIIGAMIAVLPLFRTRQKVVFSLATANQQSLFVLGNANFNLRKDSLLEITSRFYDGVYIGNKMPENFRATVQFRSEDPQTQFFIGISTITSQPSRIAFATRPYDALFTLDSHIFKQDNRTEWLIRPNTNFTVIFERKNGTTTVFMNGNLFATTDNNTSPSIITCF